MLQRQQLAALEGVAPAVQGDPVIAAALVPAEQPGVAPDRFLAQLPTRPRILSAVTPIVFILHRRIDHVHLMQHAKHVG